MFAVRWGVAAGALAAVVVGVAGAAAAGLLPVPFLPKGLWDGRRQPAPALVAVPAIVTNLAGVDAAHFAQITMTLQLSDGRQAKTFTEREAAVQNALIKDIRDDSVAALSGSGGMALLRGEVESSLDRVLGQGAVRDVFFTQFIVQ